MSDNPLFQRIARILVIGSIISFGFRGPAQAMDEARVSALTQKIIAADEPEAAYPDLEELTEIYFSSRQYNEYVDFLKNLAQKKKEFEPATDYYTALTRYYQLKHLEDSQSWDEYFDKGNDYRGSIKDSLERAIGSSAKDAGVYGLGSRLLLWKFYKGRHDADGSAALDELMSYIRRYADTKTANPEAIKEAGYELLSYDEKIRAKLVYEMYADRLASSGISQDELAKTAFGLYKEGNLGLCESIYNLYVERLLKSLPKEESAPLLLDIGKLFLYGKGKPYDAFYAENILSRAQELGGKYIFDENLTYARALSLEKTKQYGQALLVYGDLVARFPESAHADEAVFKSAFISVYALGELKEGKSLFGKLAADKHNGAYALEGIYQLGLLSQWENDLESAKKYYSQALAVGAGLSRPANKEFGRDPALGQDRLAGKPAPAMTRAEQSDIAGMAQEGLYEITNSRPMDHNLKMFMDNAIKSGGNPRLDSASLGLSADPYILDKDENVFINSSAAPLESGCVQVNMEYLWSGQFGKTKPSPENSSFDTSYQTAGPKIISLVAVTPMGTAGCDFILIDVE